MKSEREARERVVAGSLLATTVLTALLRFLLDSKRLSQEEIGAIFAAAEALIEANAGRMTDGVRAKVVEGLVDMGSHFGVSPAHH